MRLPRVLPATAAACLLLTAPASAADPVPGAHYEGTTDTGTPFAFDVAPDGRSITNVTTAGPLMCVGPEPGVNVMGIVSKTPFPVSGGSITGSDDEADPRLTMRDATFTSPTEAAGKLDALTTKFKLGEGVSSCTREIAWTAKTNAAAPAPAAPTATPGIAAPGAVAPPAAQLGTLKRAKLRRTILVPVTLTAPAAVTGQLTISAGDARRYRIGRVIARASAPAGTAGAQRLTFRPSARTLKRLRRARRLVATVRVQPAGGTAGTGRITLTR